MSDQILERYSICQDWHTQFLFRHLQVDPNFSPFEREFTKFNPKGANNMAVMKSIIKKMYHTLLPALIRNSPTIAKLKAHLLGHNWIYDSDFYESDVEGPAAHSAGIIANSILEDLKAKCIIDVGCGTGALLEALRDRGCEVFGLEYSEAALKYCRSRRLNVAKFNLSTDVFSDNRIYDVAVSIEVAEHLQEMVADRYIDLLTRLSQTIVFTAATPGQGGTDHVNEQPHSYWISKFQLRGFNYAEELSQRWSGSWKAAGDVKGWYWQNLMIFDRYNGSNR